MIDKGLMQKPAPAAATPLSRLVAWLTFAGRLLCAATVAASIAWCLAGWSEIVRPHDPPRVTTAAVEDRLGMIQELATSEWSLTADDRDLAIGTSGLQGDEFASGDGEFTVRTFRSAESSAAWLSEAHPVTNATADRFTTSVSPSEQELLDLLNDPHIQSVKQQISTTDSHDSVAAINRHETARDLQSTAVIRSSESKPQTWRIEQQFGVGVWHTEIRRNVQRLACFRGLTRLGLVSIGIEWRGSSSNDQGSRSPGNASRSYREKSGPARLMPNGSRRVAVRYDNQNKTTCELWLTHASSSELATTWLAAGWVQVGLPVPAASATPRAKLTPSPTTDPPPRSVSTAAGVASSGVETLAFTRENVRMQLVALEPDIDEERTAAEQHGPGEQLATRQATSKQAIFDRASRLVLLLIETDP